MSIFLRDASFDVVIAAGPRVAPWPTSGARAISRACSDAGLTVALIGEEDFRVMGVVPEADVGGIVLAQDAQLRIHRIRARSVVRVSEAPSLPRPFPGWRSPGLVPLSVARRLRSRARTAWGPRIVILGTGNRAFRFGSELLVSGTADALCVETRPELWGTKRYAGWEVERRRFESLGGTVVEATPVGLARKSPLVWEIKLKDSLGVRLVEVALVVSAGPFAQPGLIREYPPESLLFEIERTSGVNPEEDFDGWEQEEERGHLLAGRIVKRLVPELGEGKERVDQMVRRAKSALRALEQHRETPLSPQYSGKWLEPSSRDRILGFAGVPKSAHRTRPVASIECVEEVTCNLCQVACPENAIRQGRTLVEALCTGCGACLSACPSKTPVLVHEPEGAQMAKLGFVAPPGVWQPKQSVSLINRRGETLGSGRVASVEDNRVSIEVPAHVAWEARAFRAAKGPPPSDLPVEGGDESDRVWIHFEGDSRRVRGGTTVSEALFEIGYARAADALHCPDGSCGLCEIQADGAKKLACREIVHAGMAIRLTDPEQAAPPLGGEGWAESHLCPCLKIPEAEVVSRIQQGKLRSPDSVLSVTGVGEGKCHGQVCRESFRALLKEHGIDSDGWIDWRFPWKDWELSP